MTRLEQISIEIEKMIVELKTHLHNKTYKNEVEIIEYSVKHLGESVACLKHAAKRN